jgi:transposase-like protein
MKSVLSAKHFHNEEAAYAFVEARLWPNGPLCPHCGGVERISKMGGKSTRAGTYKCYQCRKKGIKCEGYAKNFKWKSFEDIQEQKKNAPTRRKSSGMSPTVQRI